MNGVGRSGRELGEVENYSKWARLTIYIKGRAPAATLDIVTN